jgi:hypothetical protein
MADDAPSGTETAAHLHRDIITFPLYCQPGGWHVIGARHLALERYSALAWFRWRFVADIPPS